MTGPRTPRAVDSHPGQDEARDQGVTPDPGGSRDEVHDGPGHGPADAGHAEVAPRDRHARLGPGRGASSGSTRAGSGGREVERRILVAVLAVGLLGVGAWALAWPASFHTDFPFERAWVALDGPFNEHLVRDVGALQLALGTVAALALWRPWLTGVVAVATLVFAVPHLAYHATHLAPFGMGDAVAQVVALSVQVLVPLRLLRIGPGPLAAGTFPAGRPSGGGS